MEYFKKLPLDITVDILTRLPTELVVECKLVSKTWYTLITWHPLFSKKHSDHHNHPCRADSGKSSYIAYSLGKYYFLEYNENHDKSAAAPIEKISRMNLSPPWGSTTFVGSCNGLICLARPPYLRVRTYVCNPITRECVWLPEFSKFSRIDDFYWTSGFGYVSSTNEYKVVAIVSVENLVEAYIYTLGSGTGWRYIGELKIKNGLFVWEQGVFANGFLYWKDIERDMITTFDLAEEKFCENLSPPPLPRNIDRGFHTIGVLDGFLFFGTYSVDKKAECFDIWLLKKKNDGHGKKEGEKHQSWGWTKEFRIDGKSKLVASTKSDGVLIYINNYLNIYDTKASSSKGSTSRKLVDFKGWVSYVFPHKNTLVSLSELGEEDTMLMESIESGEIGIGDQPSIQL